MSSIKLSNVCKNFGKKEVLKNISLEIEEGKIYGLLGRNGVGKTTLLRLVTNREILTSGEIFIDNENTYENQNAISKIYLMEEKNYFDEEMKIVKLFKWTKEFYDNFNMNYALDLSKKFSLDINKKLKNLSTGYKSIVKIIIALSSGSEILCFDEPILGLDANHRELFYKELLRFYENTEKTIILSTHLIEEVSNIIEKVIILKNGIVSKNGDVEELLSLAYSIAGKGSIVDEYLEKYASSKNILAVENIASYKKATIIGEKNLEAIKELGLEIEKVELQKLFVSLTGGEGQ